MMIIAGMPGGAEITVIFFLLMFSGIGFAALGLWIWMLVDCLSNEPSEGNDKLVWALVILFANWLGALIYFFVRRPKRRELYGN